MMIAGLQKLSVVDFPGQVCAIVFSQGCNFFCPYCQNPDLVKPGSGSSVSEEQVMEYLTRRKGFIDGVVISGGEPVMDANLTGFISRIRALGYKIKLDTNGSDPEKLEELLRNRQLEYVALDIKTSLDKYSLVSADKDISGKIERSIRLLMLSTVPYEFRTTCVPGILDEKDILEIGKTVKGAGKHYLQQFRPGVTLDTNFRDGKIFSKDSLEKFRKLLSEYVKEVKIRGI